MRGMLGADMEPLQSTLLDGRGKVQKNQVTASI